MFETWGLESYVFGLGPVLAQLPPIFMLRGEVYFMEDSPDEFTRTVQF
jgi:hypothetical protein